MGGGGGAWRGGEGGMIAAKESGGIMWEGEGRERFC